MALYMIRSQKERIRLNGEDDKEVVLAARQSIPRPFTVERFIDGKDRWILIDSVK